MALDFPTPSAPMRTLVALVLLLACPALAEDTQVLYLGNSYTGYNNLPWLVRQLAAAGGHEYASDSNTPGGNTLGAPQPAGWPHKSHPTSLAKIAAQDWEVVVLQDQSTLPTIPYARTQYMFTGARSLVSSIQASSAGTRTLLFQTWGRRDGGTFCFLGHCSSFADFDEMQDALTAAYAECAERVGAEVAPVGEAWRWARRLDPSIALHETDGSHPNLAGSYLAACVFYAVIFDESPVGLGFTGGLSAQQAAFFQEVAATVALCGIETYCSSLPNSFGAGARIGWAGSASVAANDLDLLVTGAVPGTSGIFFYGPQRAAVPFGDGLRCVGGGFVRISPPVVADPLGAVGRALDYTAPPMGGGAGQVAPGVTWNFQYWYRDPAGPGGSGFNLSDALAVAFCP